ncbi:hypothetical protein B9J07_27600 [Sinorhizobium sp. LM21]|uniref:DUF6651 domain-containing protein n=1 Tax=Sinorhizobium sp. LM21 TaxID=1449788 RepID=UPI0005D85855|nr:DUF6651 domain-containing protein [Sinorhizobium sp. LM21]AJW30238.1 hypothetical protein pLM21S1_p120 [Sinorhizobium sp. LM21]OWZ90357.1 hypothetical protein B9J07_27600 [Sinorhizobium sp. LM21]
MKTTTFAPAGHYASSMKIPGMPQIMFSAETGSGTGAGDADAIAAAAAAASVEKHAQETAAAEAAAAEAAAAKELQDAEDAAAAQAEAGKDAKTLADEKVKLLREVMDKKNKLKEATAATTAAQEALKAFEGVDVAKYRELIKKEQDAELAAAEAKGDFEAVKAAMATAHGAEKKTLEERIADLEGKLGEKDKTIDALTIGNDFGQSTYIKDTLTLTPAKARQLYGDHFEVKDGKTVAYDKPKSAASRNPLIDASGNPLVFDEAFKRIIEADPDKETLLKAKVTPGSNSNSTQVKTTEKKVVAARSGLDRIRASFRD